MSILSSILTYSWSSVSSEWAGSSGDSVETKFIGSVKQTFWRLVYGCNPSSVKYSLLRVLFLNLALWLIWFDICTISYPHIRKSHHWSPAQGGRVLTESYSSYLFSPMVFLSCSLTDLVSSWSDCSTAISDSDSSSRISSKLCNKPSLIFSPLAPISSYYQLLMYIWIGRLAFEIYNLSNFRSSVSSYKS